MKQITLAAVVALTLLTAGCSSMKMADTNAQSTFTYDYSVDGKSQGQLYKAAKYYFAENYNNLGAVLRLDDPDTATLYGKGLSAWNLVGNICSTAHEFRFAAKNGKARLQYELIRGIPAASACKWEWPTESGYDSIVADFNEFSVGLEKALEAGDAQQGFMDF